MYNIIPSFSFFTIAPIHLLFNNVAICHHIAGDSTAIYSHICMHQQLALDHQDFNVTIFFTYG